jgi:hypothetical protein
MAEEGQEIPGVLGHIAAFLAASVRPVLAFGFAGAVIYFTFIAYLTADAFLGIASMVIAFYFQARQAEKFQRQLEAKQQEIVDLARNAPPPPQEPESRREGRS